MTLDSETRLDSAIGLNGEFTYNYTFTNYTYEELNLPTLRKNMESRLRNQYCTAKPMVHFRNMGTQVNFIYYGKAGKQALKLSYNLSGCKEG